MEINNEQYEKIKNYMPIQRGNVSMSNVQLINAMLYVLENGCKWRSLPERFGKWHSIYMRVNRWSKNGVLDRVFIAMQVEGIINIKVEALCIDSTAVKVHQNAAGALKKTAARRSAHQGEGEQRRFIWSPHLTERLFASSLQVGSAMIPRQG